MPGAQVTAASAVQANGNAQAVSAASEQALSNVQTAASTTEQITVSVGEISGLVARTTVISRRRRSRSSTPRRRYGL